MILNTPATLLNVIADTIEEIQDDNKKNMLSFVISFNGLNVLLCSSYFKNRSI